MAVEDERQARELPIVESLRLLGTARFGRVVFARYALPTLRPVNHIVDGGCVVIRAHLGTGFSADRQVVAYEADMIDHETLLGWCVIVTGLTEAVTDAAELERYRRLLPLGISGAQARIFRIEPDIVTGISYVADRRASAGRG
ncbi:pyridoxamine 5'-phosphate oxidase family protein [Nocardia arthritidis]|nr:pyridoxamine 5'-phosphate oxidase family protein [Nocardia arthritidis]